MAEQWFDNAQLSRSFQAALWNADQLSDDNLSDFLSQPQRWNEEFEAWEEAGYPNSEDDAGWDDFLNALPDVEEEEEEEE